MSNHNEVIDVMNKANELGNLLLRALPTLDDEELRHRKMSEDPGEGTQQQREGYARIAKAFRTQASETRSALVKHGFLSQ